MPRLFVLSRRLQTYVVLLLKPAVFSSPSGVWKHARCPYTSRAVYQLQSVSLPRSRAPWS